MAIVDEDMKEDSMYSLLTSLSSNVEFENISPEDVAWADSCLNKDMYTVDSDWTSFKDALFEIISSQTESPTKFCVGQNGMRLTTNDFFRPRENLMSVNSGLGEAESIDISDDDNDDDLLLRNKRGKISIDSVFRQNYSEDVKLENLDLDLSSSLTTNDVGPSSEDIFKVWDLGIIDEQDDLIQELNTAIVDIPSQIQLNTDDSMTSKDQMQVPMDDIISGINDLSLKQYA